MPANIHQLQDVSRFEQGAQWEMGVGWDDADGDIRDLSSGWTATFVVADKQAGTAYTTRTESAGITLSDGSSGVNIVIFIVDTETVKLLKKEVYYQLELTRTSDSKVFRLMQGCAENNLQTPAP